MGLVRDQGEPSIGCVQHPLGVFPLCASLLGLLLLGSPLLDVFRQYTGALLERPEFPGAGIYLNIIINREILPIHACQCKIVPLLAVLDVLAILDVFAAVVNPIFKGEPGDMSILDAEFDSHLAYP